MSIFEAIFLGVVQGLTEFLPVSSSGHLILFRQVFGVEYPPLLFDTMVHVGTLVAVVAALWKDILAILKKIVQPITLYLIIGTIPAVVAALVFRGWLEAAFETGNYLGFAFLGTSALLVTAELMSKRAAMRAAQISGSQRNLEEAAQPSSLLPSRAGASHSPRALNWLDALIIGLCQAIAVIPGISRSGATLSGALSRGLNRDVAARFSFMLSIPIILAAALFQLMELANGGAPTAAEAAAGGIGPLAITAGTIVAAIVGFFAMRVMLKIVREKSLWGFAIYTGILGVWVLIDQFLLNIAF